MSWWKILSAAALCLLQDRLPYERSQSVPGLIARLDAGCVLRTWKIKGVIVCPWNDGLVHCLWVENAYPCGILEVVRQPLKSHLVEAPPLRTRRTTSGHNEANLQFAETRVFTFVPPLPLDLAIPLAVPRGPFLRLSYVSELDAPGWRAGLLDPPPAAVPECAGTWGCYAPRTGFVTHSSEVMASHVQALRAGRVASAPGGRVVPFSHPFEPRTGHYLQLVSPIRRSCSAIGHPDVRGIEAGALSPHGAYLFVQFGLFEVCKRCIPVRLAGPRSP